MTADRMRRQWALTLDARVRAVHAHEVAATLFARMGDPRCAAAESERAAAERTAYARAAAKHPEWSLDVPAGLRPRPTVAPQRAPTSTV